MIFSSQILTLVSYFNIFSGYMHYGHRSGLYNEIAIDLSQGLRRETTEEFEDDADTHSKSPCCSTL